MASVCLYFQVHQPFRLRRYSVFDTDPFYFDDLKNAEICRKVAHKCYLPANALLLDLIRRYGRQFQVAFAITGVAIEQFRLYAPEVLEGFQRLAQTGCVEFLGETYYHSLASLYSDDEFREQVQMHRSLMAELFNQDPRVFRNTELIYDDKLGLDLSHRGFDGCLAEGADHVLGFRSPNWLYHPPHATRFKLLLKNYRLSDDIAFRFGNRAWEHWPVTADTFAGWIDQINGNGVCCNLFMDYETLGEHQWVDTGIFQFMEHLPRAVLAAGHEFCTPSQIVDKYDVIDELAVEQSTSWADTERDTSAWVGNAMQSNALIELYKLEKTLKASGDAALLTDWRRLQASDHVYYMSTKYFADGAVHKYFSPYESPYDSYINFMNVLDNISSRVRQLA